MEYRKKNVDTQLEYQYDFGIAQKNKSSKYLKVAHQTEARFVFPKKVNNIAVFDYLNVRNYYVDIDGVRYPRDGVSIDYASNDYVDRNRDLKLFYKEYVGEEILNPFIGYTDMKTKYRIQVTGLIFRVDHIFDRTNPLFEMEKKRY